MREVPHRRARAPEIPPLARALVAAMRAVPLVFTLLLGAVATGSLAAGRGAQAAAFAGAFLLALSVAVRVAMLDARSDTRSPPRVG